MDGQERRGLGTRLSERLLRRVQTRARVSLADTLLARFGIADDWGAMLLDGPVDHSSTEGMVTLSIQPYLRRLRRLAWARRRRDARLQALGDRVAGHTALAAIRRLPGAEGHRLSPRDLWGGVPGVIASSDMLLPRSPAATPVEPGTAEESTAQVEPRSSAWSGARVSASPWLETPWSGARVVRGGSGSGSVGVGTRRATAHADRSGAARVSALDRAGQRAARTGGRQDPLVRTLEDAAPVLARTPRGRRVAREIVEILDLPPDERVVRVRRLVRRAGAVVRPFIEEVEASVPQAAARPTAVATGRMASSDPKKPRRGLRPVMASSPAMQAVRPSIPVDLPPSGGAARDTARPVEAAAGRAGRRGGAWLSSSPVRRTATVRAARALSASPVTRTRARPAVASVRSASTRSGQHQRAPSGRRRPAPSSARAGNAGARRRATAGPAAGPDAGRTGGDAGDAGPSSAAGAARGEPAGTVRAPGAAPARSQGGVVRGVATGDLARDADAGGAGSTIPAALAPGGTAGPPTPDSTRPRGASGDAAESTVAHAGSLGAAAGDRTVANSRRLRSDGSPDRGDDWAWDGDLPDGPASWAGVQLEARRGPRATDHAYERLASLQAAPSLEPGDDQGALLERVLRAPQRTARVAGAAVVRTPRGIYVPASTLALPSRSMTEAVEGSEATATSNASASPRSAPTPGVRATYVSGVPSTARVAQRRSPTTHAAERATARTRSGSVVPAAVISPAARPPVRRTSASAMTGVARALRSVRRADGTFVAARSIGDLAGGPAEATVASVRRASQASASRATARPSSSAPRRPGLSAAPERGQASVRGEPAPATDAVVDATPASWALERLVATQDHAPARRRSLVPAAVPSLRALRPIPPIDPVVADPRTVGVQGGGSRDAAGAATRPPSSVIAPAGGAAVVDGAAPTRPRPGAKPAERVARGMGERARRVPAAVAAADRAERAPVVGEAVRRVLSASPTAPRPVAAGLRTRHRPGPTTYARRSVVGAPMRVVVPAERDAMRAGKGPAEAVVARSTSDGGRAPSLASSGGARARQTGFGGTRAGSVDDGSWRALRRALLGGGPSPAATPLSRIDARALSTATWVMDASGAPPARFSAAAARRARTAQTGPRGSASWQWTADGVVLALPPVVEDAVERGAPSGSAGQPVGARPTSGARVARTPTGAYEAVRSASAPPPTRWAGARLSRTPGSRWLPTRAGVAPRGRFDARGTYRVPHAAAGRGATVSMSAGASGRVLAPAGGPELPAASEAGPLDTALPGAPTAWMSTLGPQHQGVAGGAPSGWVDGGRGRPRRRPSLASTLGTVEDGVDDPSMPTWARRASGKTLIHREDRFIDALARAEEPEDVVRIIYERAARGGLGASSGLPAPVIKIIEQIRTTAATIEPAESAAGAGPGSDAEVVRRAAVGRGGAPTGSTARVVRGFTPLRSRGTASRRDGVGADKLSKLSRRLKDLILLAERQRGAAREQVRMAEDSAAARAEGQASPGGTEGGSEKKIDIEALGREVLEVVSMELEMRKQRSQEGSDEYGWW